MKKLKRIHYIIIMICVITAIISLAAILVSMPRARATVTAEAGSDITLDMFFDKKIPKNACFSTDISLIDTAIPAEHSIEISVGRRRLPSQLIIEDTVPPSVALKENLSAWKGKLPEAADCIESITDATDTRAEWLTAPEDADGTQTGIIRVTDLGGNTTDTEAVITVTEDILQPALEGIKDITAYIFDEIDYLSGITVTDDKDTAPTVTVNTDSVSFNTPGSYTVTYTAEDGAGNSLSVNCLLTLIIDPEAPSIICKDEYNIPVGDGAIDIFSLPSVKDNSLTAPTVEIKGEVDLQTEGSYPITYTVSDRTGNTVSADCVINVAKDITPPNIAVKEIQIFLGDSVSYKKQIIVTDDFVGTPAVKVDSSGVNLNAIGSYTVTFTATDSSGNTSMATIPVSVIERPAIEEEVHRLADKLIADIMTDEMSQLEQLYAVYRWANRSIYYSGTSDKSNYLKGAYDALTTRSGDCYSYYAVCRLVMEHLGFEQIEIRRKHETTRHYWSLVKYNGVWYHFDSSRFAAGNGLTFMLTDEETAAWDRKYYSIGHIFDHSLYPERATESLQHLVDYKNKKIIKQ